MDRALEWAAELKKPLLVLEALRCDYPWASDRLHHFVLDGMAENARYFDSRVSYYPYVERTRGEGKGLLRALGERACVVVTDDFPCFFLPRMVQAAARQVRVRFEAVDSNGLLPLRAADKAFSTAHSLRRFLQKTLPRHLPDAPRSEPLAHAQIPRLKRLPRAITVRWPAITEKELSGARAWVSKLPIDHEVSPADLKGGSAAARRQLKAFLQKRLAGYAEDRNDPDHDASSGLSPYLHFGHISAHEIFEEIAKREKWNPEKLALRASGRREGWWGMSKSAEAFLDELITWRELGFNACCRLKNSDKYSSLPAWARATLAKHKRDEREHLYKLQQFERAETSDPLWNAAQNQLLREGKIHNYLRMLWGKKILEWSRSPQRALEIMIELNNKYALDGRDPNSYSGIFWCLGRYDRPWGPERPIFGTVRYMSCANTRRKLNVESYLKKYATPHRPGGGE